MLELNRVYQGDCLDLMNDIPDKSIDMILCDLPYGTTACKWDTIIPYEPLWLQYKRIIKDNGAIVLTASQPFTSALVVSNIKMFKYCWVWNKGKCSGFLNAKNAPMKKVEDIVIFSKGTTANKSLNLMQYYPQGLISYNIKKKNYNRKNDSTTGTRLCGDKWLQEWKNYHNTLFSISYETKPLHPTQKPVALFEYLIKTYTNENEIVLDNCIGSGTTAVACMQTNRNYIGMELEEKYVEIANKRINEFTQQLVFS